MPKKYSPSMIQRYHGTTGKKRLLDALCSQRIVAGAQSLAHQLAAIGQLLEKPANRVIIKQGDSDDDLYLILSGAVGIAVNGRQLTTRKAGEHVGEMALIDTTARRSATVTALERSVFLRVPEAEVVKIAAKHPDLWRRIAVEIAARLRERSKFISEPHAEPFIFVGSSTEASIEASWISKSLSRRPAVCHLWTQGVFQLSITAIEDLIRMAADSDFATLLLTPDDMTASRGRRRASPRDNVVFELGLFMGSLGRERTFLVTPQAVDLKLPTDLLGLTHVRFKTGSKKTLGKRLGLVTNTIWKRMQELGPR